VAALGAIPAINHLRHIGPLCRLAALAKHLLTDLARLEADSSTSIEGGVPHLSVYAKPIHGYDDFRASLFLGSHLCELHPVLTPLASYAMDRCRPAERLHRPYLILVRTGRLHDFVR
jgi:hypothetical protein